MPKKVFPLELLFWLIAMLALARANPAEHHYTLCPLSNLGFSWCPGCGLGRGISQVLHGNFFAAFHQHWLALPALGIIAYRIIQLSRQFILSLKPINQP